MVSALILSLGTGPTPPSAVTTGDALFLDVPRRCPGPAETAPPPPSLSLLLPGGSQHLKVPKAAQSLITVENMCEALACPRCVGGATLGNTDGRPRLWPHSPRDHVPGQKRARLVYCQSIALTASSPPAQTAYPLAAHPAWSHHLYIDVVFVDSSNYWVGVKSLCAVAHLPSPAPCLVMSIHFLRSLRKMSRSCELSPARSTQSGPVPARPEGRRLPCSPAAPAWAPPCPQLRSFIVCQFLFTCNFVFSFYQCTTY